jgi:N6-adenosine-specific RNA methylase IME4
MDLEYLKKIPVGEIAAKDCALFMWATFPNLHEALEVINAWGFQYVTTAFTWIKTYPNGRLYFGLGHYTRANAEICLLAKKGHIKKFIKSKKVEQVIITPVRKHSEKPSEVRNRIVELLGDIPRIELFARERTPGWDSLGNELDGMDIRKSIHLINVCNQIELNNKG